MTSIPVITQSFFDELKEFAALKSLPVAWPGASFDPPDTGEWLEVVLLFDDNEDYSLDDDSVSVARGTFRVGVGTKPGRGVIVILDLARQLALTFKQGHVFVDTTARVISSTSTSSPITLPDRVLVYASMRWFDTLSQEDV